MSIFLIRGGKPLSGTVRAGGNKNAALPMFAAALLTDEPVVLENVPDIGDVRTMGAIADALGVRVDHDRRAETTILTAATITTNQLPRQLCNEVRAGVLFAAPLVHRTGAARMFPPGGDVIGRRRLDAHFLGLTTLGIDCSIGDQLFFSVRKPLAGADIFLPEASVTATEHLLIAAVLARGRTIIRNAAGEPHVQDLCLLLNKMGAHIDGIGSNTLTVEGVDRLHGAHHRIGADYTEAGSFLALAAATGGGVTVGGIDPSHFRMVEHVYARLGVQLDFTADTVAVAPGQEGQIKPDTRGGIPIFDDGPWPHFPSDLMSVTIVLATQLRGTALFFEKMFESRMYFVDRLIAMGANAVICDPHRVVVVGPAKLHALELNSPDIRAGIALLGAALCADGNSTIRNVQLIDRGYERIEDKLRQLGADLERLKD